MTQVKAYPGIKKINNKPKKARRRAKLLVTKSNEAPGNVSVYLLMYAGM
jgi:hypothetical protein